MEDQSSLFCMRGEPSIFVWGGALQIQPPSWSLSHRFSSQMLSSCVLIPVALHPSSHRAGLPQRISRFRKKREEDLRKKNWSDQYENPRFAHQSGLLRCGKSYRMRWINYLRADLRRVNIIAKEEEIIVKLHTALDNRYIYTLIF
ncbi:hypothetical protein ACE6H2_003189 [Prunus campanulata]